MDSFRLRKRLCYKVWTGLTEFVNLLTFSTSLAACKSKNITKYKDILMEINYPSSLNVIRTQKHF